MSYMIEKTFRFEASHRLPDHDGPCQRLHGHSWRGTLRLSSEELVMEGPKRGMVMDFSTVKETIAEDVDKLLDHRHLNETLPMHSPTSEAIARYLFKLWKPRLLLLHAVRIEETCTSAAEYTE